MTKISIQHTQIYGKNIIALNRITGGIMKQTIVYSFFLIVSLLTLNGTAYSQSGWYKQYPLASSKSYHGVALINASTNIITVNTGFASSPFHLSTSTSAPMVISISIKKVRTTGVNNKPGG